MKKSVLSKKINAHKLLLVAVGSLMTMVSAAQTFTTKADGNWASASTWVGGVAPGRTITAGMVVNINHDVIANLTGDITISGILNVTNDTLRLPTTFKYDITLNTTGLLIVKNGGLFSQDMGARKINLLVNGGRVSFDNARVDISETIVLSAGSRRLTKNSIVKVGETYEMQGSLLSRVTDTIDNSTIQPGLQNGGDFNIKSYCTVRVANATVITGNGDFINELNSDITVLPGAANNYGFNYIRSQKDLENNGNWDARVDAYCVSGSITGINMYAIDFTRLQDCNVVNPTTPGVNTGAPELVFRNPVLKSGQANKQGAIYRFANVTPGVDAEVLLKRFSRSDIVMQSIDLANMGWDKAFQPQFGLPGLVQPNQDWYIDFEMYFYDAGTNKKRTLPKIDLTALDVDGDGNSIMEYAVFENPSNIIYSTVSYLTGQASNLLGQVFKCEIDNISSPLHSCTACGGDGKSGPWNLVSCTACSGTGFAFDACGHAYEGQSGNSLLGPVENFVNIDTNATQVMATYQYTDRQSIKFRYGAKSGAKSSNGSGIRLNSAWFRQFSLAPAQTLPVKLTNFSALTENKNVNLNWTGHEENFSHYVVQRSINGKEFSDLAVVFAKDISGSTSKYAYKDENVNSSTGSLYYRLLMVDKTSEAKLSDVRVIKIAKIKESIQLTTYPNPVVNQVKVTIPSAWQGKRVVLELFSSNGVKIQSMQINTANLNETIQMNQLAKGMYIIKVSSDTESAQQQVIKN
jgi:hypothetical protein